MNAGAAGESEGVVIVRLESVELRLLLCGINDGAVGENVGAVAVVSNRLASHQAIPSMALPLFSSNFIFQAA